MTLLPFVWYSIYRIYKEVIQMTLIEFFDRAAIENIAPALCCRPDRIIFVGDSTKKMGKCVDAYREVLERKGIYAEIVCRAVSKNNLSGIVEFLCTIVDRYGDCVFDLTGGAETYLVAVGVIMEKYKEKIQCHRYNLTSGRLCDIDADGNVCHTCELELSVEESISIYGGRVVKEGESVFATQNWSLDGEFRRDVFAMWDICRRHARRWNAQIAELGRICQYCQEGSLSVSISETEAQSVFGRGRDRVIAPDMLGELERAGLISELQADCGIRFRFKSRQVKRCLTVAGQVLELVIAFYMKDARDKDGRPVYDDVRVGVVVDWDATNAEDEIRTVNEIDVCAIRGGVPLFISCKNGSFDTEEIYKLNTVAQRFGGEYAAKVIVASELDKLGSRGEYLRARAADTGIRVIENVDEMEDQQLAKLLCGLAKK